MEGKILEHSIGLGRSSKKDDADADNAFAAGTEASDGSSAGDARDTGQSDAAGRDTAGPPSRSTDQEQPTGSADSKPLSKNQLKKRRRHEKAMAIKKRRKQQQKEAKLAKALADGRDLDEERRIQEERTKLGEGRQRREAFLQKRMKKAEQSFQVCIDCSFSAYMTTKEIGSLSSQIRYSYAMNKRSKNPCFLSIACLCGPTYDNLTKVAGFPDLWMERNFSCSDKPLVEMHPNTSKLVYLTADSENMIEHLDDNKIYVIGGIVDRNRLKGVTVAKAKELGIETAKLPISEHMKLFATKVLTCNHVFEILLKYREHGNDWKKAMLDVLPKRKDVEAIESSGGKADSCGKPNA